MGPPFYMVIRATQRSSRLQCKGSTFMTQLFSKTLREYWSGPWNPPPPTLPPRCTDWANPAQTTCLWFDLLYLRGINKLTRWQTSHANDFVNAKSHAREKPLLAEFRMSRVRPENYCSSDVWDLGSDGNDCLIFLTQYCLSLNSRI